MQELPRAAFAPDPGYLNTATVGVPPLAAVAEVHAVMEQWTRGRLSPPALDAYVARARSAWAGLAGTDPAHVAIGSTVSELVGLVAASLPDRARVVVAEGEFTSVTFPFLAHADRGVTVEELPLERLAELRGRADLVAVSAVQSADGRQVDLPAVQAAARAAGARLLLDTTQSCGWLPLDVRSVDLVVCAAYKWLLCPRGVAFLRVLPDALDELRPLSAGWYAGQDPWTSIYGSPLRPLSAGWYAGQDPWTSIYGSPLRLADDARRLDISPAWFSWVGAAVSLELLAGLDAAQVHAHDVRLADAFLERLGRPPQRSAIVTVEADEGVAQRLAAADVRTAVRAGRLRLSFHVYNDDADVQRAAAAVLADPSEDPVGPA